MVGWKISKVRREERLATYVGFFSDVVIARYTGEVVCDAPNRAVACVRRQVPRVICRKLIILNKAPPGGSGEREVGESTVDFLCLEMSKPALSQ